MHAVSTDEYIILLAHMLLLAYVSAERDMFIVLNLSFVVKFPPFFLLHAKREKQNNNRKIAHIRDDSLVLSRSNHGIVPEA